MKRYFLILTGVAVATASTADTSRYQPQPDQRHPIERPMPSIPQPAPTPWIRVAPTSTDSLLVIGGKGDTTGHVHVGPGNSVSGGVSTSHDLLGK